MILNKSINENNLENIEELIYPIFLKKTNIDIEYWKRIRSLFLSSMKNAKLNFIIRHIFWLYINKTITKGIKKGIPLIDVEKTLRNFLKKRSINKETRKEYAIKTAERSFERIKRYIVGEKILDLGAGNGLLALEIKQQLCKEIVLVDVVDYNYSDLPLILYNQEDKIPLPNKETDTTILYTVLHHSNNPEYLIKEATRVTKKRLVIMEAYIEEEDIKITNSFFDWFYNRVIGGEDINVPLNYLTINGWEKILNSYGFVITNTINIGICEPLVPEYQVLIIADCIE